LIHECIHYPMPSIESVKGQRINSSIVTFSKKPFK
jgi:hypothetical protein